MSDDGDAEEEVLLPPINYKELDSEGFYAVDHIIWKAWVQNILEKSEDDRQDVDTFVEEYSEANRYDRVRVKFVCTMGIYAGGRDEYNQRCGKGKALYPNGDTYDGDFFEGNKNGRGVYTFHSVGTSDVDKAVESALLQKRQQKADPNAASQPDQGMQAWISSLAQQLHVGKMVVQTIIEFGAIPCYHGEYCHGLRNGEGWMKHKDGSIYKGQWRNNVRHGAGTMYYMNGDIYSGLWVDGFREGYGTYVFASAKSEYKGEWIKGKMKEGQWHMSDGIIYEGKFEKNYPFDVQGVVHFPAVGLSLRGVYRKEKWAPLLQYYPMYDVGTTSTTTTGKGGHSDQEDDAPNL